MISSKIKSMILGIVGFLKERKPTIKEEMVKIIDEDNKIKNKIDAIEKDIAKEMKRIKRRKKSENVRID